MRTLHRCCRCRAVTFKVHDQKFCEHLLSLDKSLRYKPLSRRDELLVLMSSGAWFTSFALAERLGVSDRTIWRDLMALKREGVKIQGRRGRGHAGVRLEVAA